MKDDTVYLHHIIECIGRIEEDVSEGRERFLRFNKHRKKLTQAICS